jgi:hypothetical protein
MSYYYNTQGGLYLQNQSGSNLVNLITKGLTTDILPITLDKNRGVGINNTTPQHALDINGSIKCDYIATQNKDPDVNFGINCGTIRADFFSLDTQCYIRKGDEGGMILNIPTQKSLDIYHEGGISLFSVNSNGLVVNTDIRGNANIHGDIVLARRVEVSDHIQSLQLSVGGSINCLGNISGNTMNIEGTISGNGNINISGNLLANSISLGTNVINFNNNTLINTILSTTKYILQNNNSQKILYCDGATRYVGINNDNPQYNLDVIGSAKISNTLTMQTGIVSGLLTANTSHVTSFFSSRQLSRYIYIRSDANASNLDNFLPLYPLDVTGECRNSSGVWLSGSDSRVKDNIIDADLDICYNNIKNLKLRNFQWNEKYTKEKDLKDNNVIGFISQEVKDIFPKSVIESKSYGYDNFMDLNTDQIYKTMYGALQMTMKKLEDTMEKLDKLTVEFEEYKKN